MEGWVATCIYAIERCVGLLVRIVCVSLLGRYPLELVLMWHGVCWVWTGGFEWYCRFERGGGKEGFSRVDGRDGLVLVLAFFYLWE